jgi:hypothetical protein
MVADRAAEHGIAGLKSVEDSPLRNGAGYFELDLAADASEVSEVIREDNSDHGGLLQRLHFHR